MSTSPHPRVLLIDDEPGTLHALRRVLRRLPAAVTTTSSAPEALRLIKTETFAVVVSDQRMPQMDGTELLAQVKQHAPHTVRIMLTGYNDLQAAIDAVNHGAIFRYLEKPWDEDVLFRTIQEAIGEHARLKEQEQHIERLLQACEEDLSQAKAKVEEVHRLKSVVLSNLSHEVRTPLAGIISGAEIMLEEAGGELAELAELILFSGKRLLDTLNALLDLAQLESNTFGVIPERIDVSRQAQDVLGQFRRQAESAGLRLTLQAPDAPIFAVQDRYALERILCNLIANAIKFTPEGSVTITLHQEPAEVIISVEDTGIGIDPSSLARLFEAFTQASTGSTRTQEGSGLGLALTRRLVDLIGGTIHVRSEVGRGSCFTVCLPKSLEVPRSPNVQHRSPRGCSDAPSREEERRLS